MARDTSRDGITRYNHLDFKFVHKGYYHSKCSPLTDDEYVVRTRPKNDGWMAINETENIVIATGLGLSEAMSYCVNYDNQVAEAIR